MAEAIYVITYHEFNHGSKRPNHPLDSRLLDTNKNYIFYLIDQDVPPVLQDKKTILEKDLDPLLHRAGAKVFGEWSFLLAEEKHAFCEYPFFMISSRFYEKNCWLQSDLNSEWDSLFFYLHQYGWGYLPSYDRPLRWIDLSWEDSLKNRAWEYTFFPFTNQTYESIHSCFGINIPKDYRFTADLFCNYIGFKSRKELLEYVSFYKPFINFFFKEDFSNKKEMSQYVRSTGNYRNEKPFTFILELICHLYFYKKQKNYFALHYDGYYCIDESSAKIECLKRYRIPLKRKVQRWIAWKWKYFKTESSYCKYKKMLQRRPILYKTVKAIKRMFS